MVCVTSAAIIPPPSLRGAKRRSNPSLRGSHCRLPFPARVNAENNLPRAARHRAQLTASSTPLDSPVRQQRVSARILAAGSARALRQVTLASESRGRRERRVPTRTHGPRATKSTGVGPQVRPGNPAFPARMVYGLYVLSPARLGFFVTALDKTLRALRGTPATRASGPHDFTVHLACCRH